ncbi:MAG TPA: hypothetical protein VGG39_33235 [Polyangiaceae bacterium]
MLHAAGGRSRSALALAHVACPPRGGTPTVIAGADSAAIAAGCVFAIDFTGGVYTVATSAGSSSGDE